MPKSPELITKHGVFICVDNVGVLLSGKSGIGKSELALGLISRKHQLIADDSVHFSIKNNKLVGECPEVLQNFLEVRGLGILNIEAMFGKHAIKKQKELQLIINILQVNQEQLYLIDRLQGMHDVKDVLGHPIPEVSIPVAPGRNLAILVEAAVMNHQLRAKGYNASDDFAERHQDYMNRESKIG